MESDPQVRRSAPPVSTRGRGLVVNNAPPFNALKIARRNWWCGLLLGIFLSTPIFFVFPTLQLAQSFIELRRVDDRSVPLSLYVLPVLLGIAMLVGQGFYRISKFDIILVIYLIWLTLAATVGVMLNSGAFQSIVVLFAQTLFPFSGYLIARQLGMGDARRPSPFLPSSLSAFWVGVAGTTTVALILYLIQTVLDGGSSFRLGTITDHIGPFYNTKMKRFFSLYLVVAGSVIVLFGIIRVKKVWQRFLFIGLGMLCFVCVFPLHSRTALITAALSLTLIILIIFRRRSTWEITMVAAGAGIFVLVFSLFLTFFGDEALRSLNRMAATFAYGMAEDQLGAGDQTRMFLVRQSLGVMGNSLFGIAFGGIEIGSANAESGFLDMGARAGLPAMLMLLGILGSFVLIAIREILRLGGRVGSMHPGYDSEIALRLAVSVLLIVLYGFANAFINISNEAYLGPIFWALAGTLVALRQKCDYQPRIRPPRQRSTVHDPVPLKLVSSD